MVAPRKLPDTGVYQVNAPGPRRRSGEMMNRNRGGPWSALGMGGQAAPAPLSLFQSFLDELINSPLAVGMDDLLPLASASDMMPAAMPPLEAVPSMMSELPAMPRGMPVPMPAGGSGMPPLELPAAQLQAEARARRGETAMLPESSQALFPDMMPEMPRMGFRPDRAAYDMLPGPDMIIREPTAGYGRISSRWGRGGR